MKTCQWCDAGFTPKVSYQIYCSDECREAATKEKIAQKYAIARRNKLMNKKKTCTACGVLLSVYNDEDLCTTCLVNPKDVSKTLKEIKGRANGKFKETE
jgi:hypothetical protein